MLRCAGMRFTAQAWTPTVRAIIPSVAYSVSNLLISVKDTYPRALDSDQLRNDPLSGLITWVGPRTTN